jgi:phospholipid transport system substrate-binding protein
MKKLSLILILSLFLPNLAIADSKEDEVRKFVDVIGNKIITIAADKTLSDAKRKDKIISVVDDAIDADWIARFVLAKNYKEASLAQREKFTKLYRQFMINTYGPKFKNYNGRRFEVKEVTKQNIFYLAKSEFLPRDSDVVVNVDFRVKEREGKLVILDFIAEGVSLVETQRSEFNSAIAKDGMDKFLKNLEERVRQLKNQK